MGALIALAKGVRRKTAEVTPLPQKFLRGRDSEENRISWLPEGLSKLFELRSAGPHVAGLRRLPLQPESFNCQAPLNYECWTQVTTNNHHTAGSVGTRFFSPSLFVANETREPTILELYR